MDRYVLLAGVLRKEGSKDALMCIKGGVSGPAKRLLSPEGVCVAATGIRNMDREACPGRADSHAYVLADGGGREYAVATPHYAPGADPAESGWPVCRMPKVDHADMTAAGKAYELYMDSEENYTLYDCAHHPVVHLLHRGLAGGWIIEDTEGFSPQLLCAVFVFCRYIERENAFITV